MKLMLRFVAPHLIRLWDDDRADDCRYWAAAFTSQEMRSVHAGRYLHRCRFVQHSQPCNEHASVTWRLESQLISPVPSSVSCSVEGRAPSLVEARNMVLDTARQHHQRQHGTQSPVLAPAFIMLPALPHYPRVWAGGAEVEASTSSGQQVSRRLCIIRERLHRHDPVFSCAIETLEHEGQPPTQWLCRTLQNASRSGCEALLEAI